MAKRSFDIYAHVGLMLGAFALVRPLPEFSIIVGSFLIFFSLSYLIMNLQWDWTRKIKWIRPFGCFGALVLVVLMASFSWPKDELPDIVLKIDPLMLPIHRETDVIHSLEIMGRFPSHVGSGYGPADKYSEYWPSKDMEYPSQALRYTLINRGKSILYKLKFDFEIVHDESIPTPHGFTQGDSVYTFVSTVAVDELIPYGLTSQEGNFVFYVRNLSEDVVYVVPPDFVILDGGQKVKIRKLGPLLPLDPPRSHP